MADNAGSHNGAAPVASSSAGGAFKLKFKLSAPSAASSGTTVVEDSKQFSPPAAYGGASNVTPTTSNKNSHRTKASIAAAVRAEEVNLREKQEELRTKIDANAKEVKGVSAAKYRALKRKYEDAVEKSDSTSLTLYRTQSNLVRLREERTALLERVLALETAAGLTSSDIATAEAAFRQAEVGGEHPLLSRPALPSLEDRAPRLPVVTTASELANDSYNKPLDAPLPPLSVAPRYRSKHYISTLAAQKLRDDVEARRAAAGLPKPTFPAVAILGLEGTFVGDQIERLLSGEQVVLQDAPVAAPASSNKRRRESTAPAGKGKGKEVYYPPPVPSADAQAAAALHALPNPFAAPPIMPPAPLPVHQPVQATPEPPRLPSVPVETAPYSSPAIQYSTAYDDVPTPGSHMSYEDEEQKPYVYPGSGSGGSVPPVPPPPTIDSNGVPIKRISGVSKKAEGLKPKKVKAHGITSGQFNIPYIPRDNQGKPKLPMSIGIMVLKSVGQINTGEHWHTERYIFPVGFESVRKYPSMINPTETIEYTCRIVDGGNNAPRFEIYPSDQPGIAITAGTPTGAWSQIVKSANRIRERNHSNSVSGPDYFGLASNITKALIQELPDAWHCLGYVWQTFIEDPDPATLGPDAAKLKKASTGQRKVQGAKRKFNVEDDGASETSMAVDALTSFGETPVHGAPVHGSPAPVTHYSPTALGLPPLSAVTSGSESPYSVPVGGGFNPYDLPAPSPGTSTNGKPSWDPYSLPPAGEPTWE